MNHEKPPKSTPGDGSRSTWGDPCVPAAASSTWGDPCVPATGSPILGDFNSYSPQNWGGAWGPLWGTRGPLWGLGAGGSGGAKILFVQEVY
jgi:hypothetical protein